MADRSINTKFVTVEFAVEGVFVLTGRIAEQGNADHSLVYNVRADRPAILQALRTSAEVYGTSHHRGGAIKDFLGQFELTLPSASELTAPRLLAQHGHLLYQHMMLAATRNLDPLPAGEMQKEIDRLTS